MDNSINQSVKELIEQWDKAQGHDHCHYYPEIFKAIAKLVGAELISDHGLPPIQEFKAGCRRFQDEEFKVASDDTWMDHLVDDLNKIVKRTTGFGLVAGAKRDFKDAIGKHLNCEGG